MRKKAAALALAGAMAFSMVLGGCGSETADSGTAPETAAAAETESVQESVQESTAKEETVSETTETGITAGYYMIEIEGGGLSFVHFAEDGTYYGKYFGGSVTEAGTYQVLDEEMEYALDGGADEDYNTTEDNTMDTAAQVVEFTSYKTGTPVKVAFVDDELRDMSLGGMANHRTLTHDASYDYNPDVEEVAIEVYVFYANQSIGSTLILSHNKTFNDLTGDSFLEGTWEMKGAGSFELAYSDGTQGSLTVEEDGKHGTLVRGEEEIALSYTYEEEDDTANAVATSLVAEDVEVGLPMSVDLRLDCYSDNTCKLFVLISQTGAECEADAGTYEVSETYRYTFRFDIAGELAAEPDYANASAETGLSMTLAYQGEMEIEANGSAMPVSIDSELTGQVAQ